MSEIEASEHWYSSALKALQDVASSHVPPEIMKAAREIERYFRERDIEHWELMGICSRNHADALRKLLNEHEKVNCERNKGIL